MIAAGIDHVLIATTDLESSRAELANIGFQLSPRGNHVQFGTANYLCVFEGSYLELIGIVEHDPVDRTVQQMLQPSMLSGGGVPALALATDDASAAYGVLRSADIAVSAPQTWSRAADSPDGSRTATFTTMFVAAATSPGYTTFFCQHHTPALVYQPRWQRHRNGVFALAGVGQHSVLPAHEIAAAYGRYLGENAVVSSPDRVLVRVGAQTIEFLKGAATPRFFIRLRTRSQPSVAKELLGRAEQTTSDAVAIPLQTVPSVSLLLEDDPG